MSKAILRFKLAFAWIAVLAFPLFAQPEITTIEEYIENARNDWKIPGMAVAIVKNGEIISNRGYGVLEEGSDIKADQYTLFAIASNTKAFLSTSLGMLQSDGLLRLNDRVRKYLPGFHLYDSYVSDEVTIADLLSHRIGLGTFSGDIIWYKTDIKPEQVVERVRYLPKQFSFRNGYGYSNVMYITAGEVIKKVTGQPWSTFVQNRITSPLGMSRTYTSVNDLEKAGNFATPHKTSGNSNLPIEWVNWDNMGAAGSIISCADDMAKWLIFQLNQGIWGKDTLFQPAVQNICWTPHNNLVVPLESRANQPGTNFRGYGLGWLVSDYYGNRLITHGGAYDGMYSMVALVPEQQLGLVILTNSMTSVMTPLHYYIIDAMIGNETRDWSAEYLQRAKRPRAFESEIEAIKKARASGTKPLFNLMAYCGTYQTDLLGKIHITQQNNDLRLTFEHAPKLAATLTHWDYDTWEIKWDHVHAWFDFGVVQFHHDNRMNVTGFEFDVPNQDIFFNELRVEKTP